MQYIIEGIAFGLTLAILLGPIFIILIQTSIEKGSRAGLVAASGIWVSDIIIVGLCLFFISSIGEYVEDDGFKLWVGSIGGAVLIGVGILTYIKKPQIREKVLDALDDAHQGTDTKKKSGRHQVSLTDYVKAWIKGFMVNTINPFTIIFWFSTITAFVAKRDLNQLESLLFAGAIIATIIVTDTCKVIFARFIRSSINEHHLKRINQIAGIALVLFGIALAWRVVMTEQSLL